MSQKSTEARDVDSLLDEERSLQGTTGTLNLILAYLPALLGLVVQVALLGLVVKQWILIDRIQSDGQVGKRS